MRKFAYYIPIILCIITLLAGVLRIYGLSDYPTGFHIDEASLGYNGYSMLKTGKDEHGNRFPLYIDMFGDNRPSGYHYLTIIPIAVFGLNEFATRLPGALFGTISIIAFFFLVRVISKNDKISILASLLLAISPWHVVSSRASAEAIVALFFIMTGVTSIVHSFDSKKIRFLALGCFLVTMSFFFYHTPRVFVPLLLIGIALVNFNDLKKYSLNFKISGIMCFLAVSLVSFLLVFIIKGGTGRFTQVSIFGFPETRLVMEEQIREDGTKKLTPIVSRSFHNKITNYSLTFVTNYLDYFSGKFLFMSGGQPRWYRVPGMGMLYLFELPFIVFGFIYVAVKQSRYLKMILMWLIAAPLVASVTVDDIPNIQRVMVMFPMLEILASIGIVMLLSRWKGLMRHAYIIMVCIGMCGNMAYFMHQYVIHGSTHETIFRFNGFKEMVLEVRKVYDQFDTIIVTKTLGGIYPHVLFFMDYDPILYQKEGSPKDKNYKGFGKFIFTPQSCPSVNGDDNLPTTGRILYVNSETCKIPPLVTQKRIYREDGSTAFILVYPQDY